MVNRITLFVVLLLAVIGLLGWRAYHNLTHPHQYAMAGPVVRSSPAPASGGEKAKAKTVEEMQDVLIRETFMGYMDFNCYGYVGKPRLRTDKGIYMAGELSIHGLVQSIRKIQSDYAVVACVQPGGKRAWVIAQFLGTPPPSGDRADGSDALEPPPTLAAGLGR
jgi:hypothetical protein